MLAPVRRGGLDTPPSDLAIDAIAVADYTATKDIDKCAGAWHSRRGPLKKADLERAIAERPTPT